MRFSTGFNKQSNIIEKKYNYSICRKKEVDKNSKNVYLQVNIPPYSFVGLTAEYIKFLGGVAGRSRRGCI